MDTQKTYFVENKEITEQVNKIKRIIRGSMNGITVVPGLTHDLVDFGFSDSILPLVDLGVVKGLSQHSGYRFHFANGSLIDPAARWIGVIL